MSFADEQLIGFHTVSRPYESIYAFTSRLIRCNFLSDREISRLIPKALSDTAFFLGNGEPQDLEAVLGPHVPNKEIANLKCFTAGWSPYPYLDSSPPERLRGCPVCLMQGSHSLAFQGDLLALCPLHDEPLVYNCFKCGSPLFWKSANTFAKSAFHCSRGCDLLEKLFAGLDGIHTNNLDVHLERHLGFVEKLQSGLRVMSGPGYVPYPLRLHDKSIEMPERPSRGLLPAILYALRPHAPELPEFQSFHCSQSGAWITSVERWMPAIEDAYVAHPLNIFEMQRVFKRTAYHTTLPKPKTPFESSLADDLIQQSVAILNESEETIDVPSHLLTNNDFFALRDLFFERNHAHEHYKACLTDLLKRGVDRHHAISRDPPVTPGVLALTEWVSLIVQVSTGTFRVRAETRHLGNASMDTWKLYTDWAMDDAPSR